MLRLIITVTSLLHCSLALADSFDLDVRVKNDGSAFLETSRLCGLAPLALNGVAYFWEITGSMPVSREGQRYCVSLEGVGPYQSRHVSLHWQPLAKRAGEGEASGFPGLFARPSPELIELAKSFGRYRKSERVRRIYDWMIRNIAFSGIRQGIDGAEHALLTRQGDCTEHMLLAAQLLERNGFTIRRVLGMTMPKDQFRITSQSLHNWLEYLEGGEWLIFDSTRGILGKPDRQNYVALHFYESGQQLRLAPLSADRPHLKLYLQ